MFLIVGGLIVLGSVVSGYLMEGGNLLVLRQPAEFIIIGGAALGSLLISTPVKVLKELLGQMRGFFGGGLSKADYLELLAMQYQLFRLSQQSGVMSLEAHFEEPDKSSIMSQYPKFLARHHAVDFLADSVKVIIIGGIAPHDLESLMDEDLQVHHDDAARPAGILAKVGDALPGLGIVAAVLGVVNTMGAIDGPPSEIGHKVAAALIGTFLGILMSYGFVQPMATNLEQQQVDHGRYAQCLKAGLLASYKGFPPAIAVEFARRVLPGDVRPSFNETEQHCRAPKPAENAAA
ncbi:MAG TPA: flagellar motor stator protein MotA [Vicinamibacterales bacterium]|nr:flagellar motor stator protein MotA [Vicinamibacterales bacterium]